MQHLRPITRLIDDGHQLWHFLGDLDAAILRRRQPQAWDEHIMQQRPPGRDRLQILYRVHGMH